MLRERERRFVWWSAQDTCARPLCLQTRIPCRVLQCAPHCERLWTCAPNWVAGRQMPIYTRARDPAAVAFRQSTGNVLHNRQRQKDFCWQLNVLLRIEKLLQCLNFKVPHKFNTLFAFFTTLFYLWNSKVTPCQAIFFIPLYQHWLRSFISISKFFIW